MEDPGWPAPMDAEAPLETGRACTTHKAASGAEASYMESWGDSIVAAHGETARLADVLGVTSPPVRIDSMVRSFIFFSFLFWGAGRGNFFACSLRSGHRPRVSGTRR